MQAGSYDVTFLDMGSIRLDGGAMFGVVPRALWSRYFEPNAANTIVLACRGLLLQGAGHTIVIDTGAGTRWTDKERERYGITNRDVCDAVVDAGVPVDAVTDVILTHLHFDHAGGAVASDGEPAFPNATYTVQERALSWARSPTERDAGSFRADDYEPLVRAGVLRVVDGACEVLPDIRVRLSEGHTTGLQIPVIGDTLVYPADLIPTTAHLRPAWVMAYDIRPLQSVAEKRALLLDAVASGWRIVYEHDPQVTSSRVTQRDGRFVMEAPIA